MAVQCNHPRACTSRKRLLFDSESGDIDDVSFETSDEYIPTSTDTSDSENICFKVS